MMMDRHGGKSKTCCLSDKEEGGRLLADVVPHLQCSAGLHHPIIFELSVKGAGKRLTTAKESSRSDGEKERERAGGKSERGSQRVQWCSRTQPTAELLHFSSSFSSSFPALCSLLSSFLSSASLLFATPFLCNLGFSVISIDCSLLLIPSTFHYPFFSLFSLGSQSLFFPLGGWSERFLLTPALSPLLFPCITSHGHPCILQVRAGCVCEGVWAGVTATVRGCLETAPGVLECCRSP